MDIYRWHDEIFDVPESRATLHTRASLLDAIIERVNERHPNEVPCVVAKRFTGGSDPYLRWIVAVTGDEDQDYEDPDRVSSDRQAPLDETHRWPSGPTVSLG